MSQVFVQLVFRFFGSQVLLQLLSFVFVIWIIFVFIIWFIVYLVSLSVFCTNVSAVLLAGYSYHKKQTTAMITIINNATIIFGIISLNLIASFKLLLLLNVGEASCCSSSSGIIASGAFSIQRKHFV